MVRSTAAVSEIALLAGLEAKTVNNHYRQLIVAGLIDGVIRGAGARDLTVTDARRLVLSVAIAPQQPTLGAQRVESFESLVIHHMIGPYDTRLNKAKISVLGMVVGVGDRLGEVIDRYMQMHYDEAASDEAVALPGEELRLRMEDTTGILTARGCRFSFMPADLSVFLEPGSIRREVAIPLCSLAGLAHFLRDGVSRAD